MPQIKHVESFDFQAMRKRFFFLLCLATMLCSCTQHNDSLIGTWTVSKVNVQFDDQRNTPELVKQVGEMEKQNVIVISKDSILTFTGLDEEWQSRASLINDTLYLEGTAFGVWKNGEIVTWTNSPLGEVVVVYKKE